MADGLRGAELLLSELEKAKESLKGVDENIKKLTGRDPTLQWTSPPQRRVSVGAVEQGVGNSRAAESRIFSLARRGIVQADPGPRPRRGGGAFSRLGPRPGGRGNRLQQHDSGDEEDTRGRPALQSSVVATPVREERSRKMSIEEQNTDRKGQARNRRMFGLLLGTLQKFKDESKESKEKEEQRIKIEKKLEDKFRQEKEEILKERRDLFLERRRKQIRIKLIEQKMEMVQNHESWERETKKLQNFILTKAKPCLFYMPKMLTEDSETKLQDTKLAVDAMIENRRKKLDEEINDLMNRIQDNEEGGNDDNEEEEEEHEEGENEDDENHPSRGEEKMGDSEGEERKERNRDSNREEKENNESFQDDDKEEMEMNERELRDKEREQRDRDRRMREQAERERAHKRAPSETKEGSPSKSSEPKVRSKSGEQRVRSHQDRKRSRSHSRGRRSKSREKHRSGSRDRHRSGKREKRDSHHSGEKSKSRRSKGEGKAEKSSKVWEPMEDEEEEEFVGSKPDTVTESGNIQSRMLQMAGLADAYQSVSKKGADRREAGEGRDWMDSVYGQRVERKAGDNQRSEGEEQNEYSQDNTESGPENDASS
ncbi:pinin-like [Dreissena polymorpha]|nr:pinin-like [Dreissena polymorpha]